MGESRMSRQRHWLAADWQASEKDHQRDTGQASQQDKADGHRDVAGGHPDKAGGHPDKAGGHRDVAGGDQGATLLGAARHELALARQIRARELVAAAPPCAVAAAIRAQCEPAFGTTWIRAYRLALGITLADVVAQVRAWYQAEGRRAPRFSETLLSAYEGGQKRPGPEYLHYLCAAYRADPEDLGYDGRCICGRTHRPSRPDAVRRDVPVSGGSAVQRPPRPAPAAPRLAAGGPVTDTADEPARHGRGCAAPGAAAPARRSRGGQRTPDAAQTSDGAADDDELRRTLLRLITDRGAGVDGRFLGAVDRIRRRMDEALLGATVSATMIDQWEETTAGYGRQYMTVPPLRLLCDALLDFGDVRRMCQERQPIEFEERLCRLAGQLASLAGMIMINLGDQRLARSLFRTARTATDETGDRRLRAWVAAREALVPLYYGDPQEAAALAGTAIGLAGRNACVAAVMAPVVEARAIARLAGRGRREALMRARTALDRAHDALADLPDEDRAGTAFGYTERQLLFHEGDTLVTLGDWQGASRAFSQASRLYSPAEFLDPSLVALGQARCLLESDEPEQALRLSRDTLLSLAREHRSQIVVQGARALGMAVAARHADLPAVREYREALLTA
jgi:transcriptional regulator with XRE-family HTH domain/tetratricopeptide (TPR) repeat protein